MSVPAGKGGPEAMFTWKSWHCCYPPSGETEAVYQTPAHFTTSPQNSDSEKRRTRYDFILGVEITL